MHAPCSDPDRHDAAPQAIVAVAEDYQHGSVVPPHRHGRAQLLFATTGTMRVATEDGAWIVPPLRAVWIPPGIEHGWQVSGTVALRTLFIRPDAAPFLPTGQCRVIEVSGLLRALILAAMDEPLEKEASPRAALIAGLILDELSRAAEVPLRLPLPRDPRLLALCRALLAEPSRTDTLEDWAGHAGASGKTLARLFLRETSLTFGAWRQQARLAEAVARLSLGEPVAMVARAVGYDGASAFTAMFRRVLGQSPRDYLRPAGAGPADSPCIPGAQSP